MVCIDVTAHPIFLTFNYLHKFTAFHLHITETAQRLTSTAIRAVTGEPCYSLTHGKMTSYVVSYVLQNYISFMVNDI